MNLFNIAKAFEQKKERGWHTLYVLVDAHGTLIKPAHDRVEFYPYATEIIRWFNKRPDFKVILWTSSHPEEIRKIHEACFDNGIHFDFVNENPLEGNSERANFSKKFYFNILIDDKGGMTPETDWLAIWKELERLGEWDKVPQIPIQVVDNIKRRDKLEIQL